MIYSKKGHGLLTVTFSNSDWNGIDMDLFGQILTFAHE